MIKSQKFTAVIDANILYKLWQRDILLWLAMYDLYRPIWSQEILDEVIRVFDSKNKRHVGERLAKGLLSQFEGSFIKNYEYLIPVIELPDENDRHVLAVAIKENANVIVTDNVKDFPEDVCSKYGVSIKSTDDFLCDIIDLDIEDVLEAFYEMVRNKKNPNMDTYECLKALKKNNMENTSNFLRAFV